MGLKSVTERRNLMIDYIKANHELRVSDAVDLFGVSDETVRKDFAFMENKGILKKVHGGAVLAESDVVQPMTKRSAFNYEEKILIAKKAMEFVPKDKCIIGLDIGSTVAIFAGMLAEISGNTLITNSFPVLQKVVDSSNVIFGTGGEYRAEDMSFQGVATEQSIREMAIDISFMGTSGVLNRNGICSTNFFDIGVKKGYAERSEKVCVLMDSTKFKKSSLVEVVEWKEIDCIITDSGIDDKTYNELSKQVNLIVAE